MALHRSLPERTVGVDVSVGEHPPVNESRGRTRRASRLCRRPLTKAEAFCKPKCCRGSDGAPRLAHRFSRGSTLQRLLSVMPAAWGAAVGHIAVIQAPQERLRWWAAFSVLPTFPARQLVRFMRTSADQAGQLALSTHIRPSRIDEADLRESRDTGLTSPVFDIQRNEWCVGPTYRRPASLISDASQAKHSESTAICRRQDGYPHFAFSHAINPPCDCLRDFFHPPSGGDGRARKQPTPSTARLHLQRAVRIWAAGNAQRRGSDPC
jgi:hypothetical protein